MKNIVLKIIYAFLLIFICTSCDNNLKSDETGKYYVRKNSKEEFYAKNEFVIINNKLCYFTEKEYMATNNSELPYGYEFDINGEIYRKPFEIIQFGNFEQDNDLNNGKEKIDWIILDKKDGKAVLMTLYGIDCQFYNEIFSYEDYCDWPNSNLKKYLNDTFYNEAFDKNEKEKIVTIINDTNSVDNVYIPSIDEIYRYLPLKKDRICYATNHIKNTRAYVSNDLLCNYMLRTSENLYIYGINCYGEVARMSNSGGADVVRPMITIKYE